MAKKIAIVEDDLAIAQMYRLKFEADGYEVQTAENGKVGLELVGNFRPDLILLDLMMPEMNGDELLRELRKNDWAKDIKVLVLTNVGQEEVAEKLKDTPIDGIIMKALLTPKMVAEKVQELFSGKSK